MSLPVNKEEEEEIILVTCRECTANYEKELAALAFHKPSFANQLPCWLQSHPSQSPQKVYIYSPFLFHKYLFFNFISTLCKSQEIKFVLGRHNQ